MKNEKYLVIEEAKLEKLIQDMKDNRNFAHTGSYLNPLDETI